MGSIRAAFLLAEPEIARITDPLADDADNRALPTS
jgi:hypothetical protein